MNPNDHYIVITSDTHAGASMATYREYLAPEYQDAFTKWRGNYTNPFRDLQDGGKTRNWDDERRMSELESDGIVAEVVFPNTVPPFFPTGAIMARPPSPEDYELRLAGIRAHNHWLADWCARFPERRAGIAQVFLNDVDDAVGEARFAHGHDLRGGILVPYVPDDATHLKALYDESYDPLWKVCEELGIVVNFHSGGGAPDYGASPARVFLTPMEMSFYANRAMSHLILGGVFVRFPNLQVAFTEQGADWALPQMRMADMLHGMAVQTGRVGELKLDKEAALPEAPSYYLKRNVWFGTAVHVESQALAELSDRVMWGSDYPHYEGTYPNSKKAIRRALAGVDPDTVQAVLGGNAAELYGFNLGALAPLAARYGPTVEEVATPLDAADDVPSLLGGMGMAVRGPAVEAR